MSRGRSSLKKSPSSFSKRSSLVALYSGRRFGHRISLKRQPRSRSHTLGGSSRRLCWFAGSPPRLTRRSTPGAPGPESVPASAPGWIWPLAVVVGPARSSIQSEGDEQHPEGDNHKLDAPVKQGHSDDAEQHTTQHKHQPPAHAMESHSPVPDHGPSQIVDRL
jgi:hypothetical protein